MTEEEIRNFEKIQAQLEGMHAEVSGLSKKSQNDALNKFKIKFINNIIDGANKILGDKYLPFSYFTQFDEDDIPSNSDVAMIVGQYLKCMENLRSDNIEKQEERVGLKFVGFQWYWKGTKISTSRPKKLDGKE